MMRYLAGLASGIGLCVAGVTLLYLHDITEGRKRAQSEWQRAQAMSRRYYKIAATPPHEAVAQ